MPIVNDQRTPGWFWMHDRIYDTYIPEIGHMAALVYMSLARHANKAGQAWPAKSTIASELKMSQRTVDAAIDTLVRHKLIQVTKRLTENGGWSSNIYTLLDPPRFMVKPPAKSLDDLAAEAKNQPDPAPAPSSSPSMDSPSNVFPLCARTAPPLGHQLPQGGATDDRDGARTAPPPSQNANPQPPASFMDADTWSQAKASLRLQLPKSTYETWVKETTLVTADDETYTICAPNANVRDWLNARLKRKARNVLASILGHNIDVQFITAQEVTH